MKNWYLNFAIIWMSVFLMTTGFSFAMPFAPFYLQELGVQGQTQLKFWVALFAAACPLTLAVFSPIWGILADRYGRRPMLLRANFGGMLVLGLMGVAPNPATLIALRLLQGMISGNFIAAQTMVASQVPPQHSGFALGSLSAAVFSGNMVGAAIGGLFAEWFGYRTSFLAAAALMAIAGLLVLFGTRENYRMPENNAASKRDSNRHLGLALPILVIIMLIAFVRQFDHAWLPLMVQKLHGGLDGAAWRTGLLVFAGGVAGFIAGPLIGRLTDRISPPTIGKLSAVCAGVMMIPAALAPNFAWLLAARFGAVFFAGGLEPVFHIWLAKITPEAYRGKVFGWSGTARSIGWMITPVAGGLVAWLGGLRAVFGCAVLLYIGLYPAITWVVSKRLANQGVI